MIHMTFKAEEKTEYNETLEFFLALCTFPVVSSTFGCMTEEEKKEMNSRIRVLTTYMIEVLPQIQEREAVAEQNVRTNSNSGSTT